ncbi:hypothetical protein F5884DRAFT_35990 [Xylogone sp. PMI_703]|nr:hypothetical protein F5884DRAFT_35990 [Xylogone sp. PMI_703]
MAPLLEDPRIRQTWNQFSHNAESVTEEAAAGIWTFQHTYIRPCLSSIAIGFEQCTATCLPDRDAHARRLRDRTRTRGRAESSFDFYDDWDADDGLSGSGLLGGWGNDELDRLLAGSGSQSRHGTTNQAPRRQRGMSYGTRGRRKSLDPDPTVIPSTSALGFLGRLPFKLGGTLRYKPSAADLQEHPGTLRSNAEEGEPLMDTHSEDEGDQRRHGRKRSLTASSGETSDSFRSRGDLFPSDGEDDAVPIDDEFAMALERRINTDDRSSGKTRSSKGKRQSRSRAVSGIVPQIGDFPSSGRPSLETQRMNSGSSGQLGDASSLSTLGIAEPPTITDLQEEEERLRVEEEIEVERKREAAAKLAMDRGLHVAKHSTDSPPKVEEDPEVHTPPPPSTSGPEKIDKVDSDQTSSTPRIEDNPNPNTSNGFSPARLPHFS